IDPDGYVVSVNGVASRRAPANGGMAVLGLVPGTAGVVLEDVAPKCTPATSYPPTVELEPGRTETMYIDVTCVPLQRLGELEVVLRGWRATLPAAEYGVLVDGREWGVAMPGQPLLITEVLSGQRGVEI